MQYNQTLTLSVGERVTNALFGRYDTPICVVCGVEATTRQHRLCRKHGGPYRSVANTPPVPAGTVTARNNGIITVRWDDGEVSHIHPRNCEAIELETR